MRVRVLGSAAGGGFPQWNCRCGTCEAARVGERARRRTQSSLAIRGNEGPWWLVNASPDLRQQFELLERPDGVRASPVAGVLLTDAEIDHTAGLLLMRESSAPLRVFGAATVEQALRGTLLRMLERFCGVDWHTLDRSQRLEGASLIVEPFAVGKATGLTFRDGATVTYAPALATLDDDVLERFAASDVVLVDGTFWHEDELARLGISQRTAADMGHVPLSRSLQPLAALPARTILVHINNTNPILLEDSPEREQVVRAGIEVAYDGLEVEL
ncbi:MAG TPA: pyrroloquinoline quinone biosynthesis protein PqqB [Solirubrobacter sp.]|nr:pyrroloquinoline quinone biosynthesis protein PqqB [Solirubrobacter sp.]